MDIASLVFRRAVATGGLRGMLWSAARRGLIGWLDDPVCSMPVHGRNLRINLSHGLPIYRARHPCYDSLPGRLGPFLRRRRGSLVGIDVGANVGDSVAAFLGPDTPGSAGDGAPDRFLAIEPNPKFWRILLDNWGHDARVTPLATLCSSGSQTASFTIHEKNGTASIVQSAEGASMAQQPLDDIVADHPTFADTNLIKVDTDGHDFEVLASAAQTIATNRPAVLFECDVFGRADYTDSVLGTLGLFAHCGYTRCLVYDNLGYLLGCHRLDNPAAIQTLLFYQLTSELGYLDLLLMTEPDLADFHAAELRFFVEQRVQPALRATVLRAAEGARQSGGPDRAGVATDTRTP